MVKTKQPIRPHSRRQRRARTRKNAYTGCYSTVHFGPVLYRGVFAGLTGTDASGRTSWCCCLDGPTILFLPGGTQPRLRYYDALEVSGELGEETTTKVRRVGFIMMVSWVVVGDPQKCRTVQDETGVGGSVRGNVKGTPHNITAPPGEISYQEIAYGDQVGVNLFRTNAAGEKMFTGLLPRGFKGTFSVNGPIVLSCQGTDFMGNRTKPTLTHTVNFELSMPIDLTGF